jgi:putative transposase
MLYFEGNNAEIATYSLQDFHMKYLTRTWSVVKESLVEPLPLQEVAARDLQTYKESDRKKAERKFEYLKPFLELGKFISTPNTIIPILLETAKRLNDKNPPSPSSIIRWQKRYEKGKSIICLIDRAEDRGRRPEMGADILDIIDHAVDTIYLSIQRRPAKAVHEAVVLAVSRRNQSKSDDQKLKEPSRAKIYRYINGLNKYVVEAARLGKRTADNTYRKVVDKQEARFLMERWETDHTPLNIILVDGEGKTIGKPWLTTIIDKCSRMLVGFYITFGPPSVLSIMSCLKMAILPKEEFLSQFNSIKHNWPAHGIPVLLVCDNGMEFLSEALRQACFEMAIHLMFCRSKQGRDKGAEERFQRRVNEEICHLLPGTVFSNPTQRGEYESEKLARVEFKPLLEIVTKWAVDIYAQTVHKELGITPYQAWINGLEHCKPIELPADPQQMEIILGVPAKRQLFHYGVEINNLYYNSDALHSIFSRLGKVEVDLKYYEYDLGYVHVFDSSAKEYLRVPCNNKSYAPGLTLGQHKALKKQQRDQGVKGQKDLFESREHLQNMFDDLSRSKKMGSRKKSVVMKGISSANPDGLVVAPNPNEMLEARRLFADIRDTKRELPKLTVSINHARNPQASFFGEKS